MSDKKRKIELKTRGVTPDVLRGRLATLLDGLARGGVELRLGDDALQLPPGEVFKLEVKAKQKDDRQQLAFKLTWEAPEHPDALVSPVVIQGQVEEEEGAAPSSTDSDQGEEESHDGQEEEADQSEEESDDTAARQTATDAEVLHAEAAAVFGSPEQSEAVDAPETQTPVADKSASGWMSWRVG